MWRTEAADVVNSSGLWRLTPNRALLRFGTVRPRVQIPGPRPISSSKSPILDLICGHRGTAGAQIRGEPRNEAAKSLALVGRSELGRQGLGACAQLYIRRRNCQDVRHAVRKSQLGASDGAQDREAPGSKSRPRTSLPNIAIPHANFEEAKTARFRTSGWRVPSRARTHAPSARSR